MQKIARISVISEGTVFYRGLNRRMELPDCFFHPDPQGRRGYAEWGFLSTTQDKEIALSYSGVRDGGRRQQTPMVMVMAASAVDRGAAIHVTIFSQYPKVTASPAATAACNHSAPLLCVFGS